MLHHASSAFPILNGRRHFTMPRWPRSVMSGSGTTSGRGKQGRQSATAIPAAGTNWRSSIGRMASARPVRAFIWRLPLRAARRSIGFMPRQSRMAAVTMAGPACGLTTVSTIMRRSSSIPTDMLSKPCSIRPSNKSSFAQTSSGRSFGSNWMMVIHFAVSAGFFSFSISIETS